MKEATGELNMTVITIAIIAAVVALFYFLIWPMIQGGLTANARCANAYGCGTCDTNNVMTCQGYYESDGTATPGELTCSCGDV